MGMMAGLCSKHDVKVAGNKVTSDAVCDLGVDEDADDVRDDAHRRHRVPHRGARRRSIRRSRA